MIINRNMLAIYCSGQGIEIGPYHSPFPLGRCATIKNVDKWPYEKLVEMRNQDPNLSNDTPIAPVDIIDDGEYLETMSDRTLDFLISSHQLEHCKSPITAIHNHIRVLKTGKFAIYAVPDKRFTFDKNRPLTKMSTLTELYHASRKTLNSLLVPIYDEYYINVDKITDSEERMKRTENALSSNADIHFHVWDAESLMDMLLSWSTAIQYEIELFARGGHENFVVLKKL